ncbi:rhodanese-like domain-containing protein [Anaerococcus sp. NML200537]|uniref:rhodanese-like domain-containing protein n=1 Tax=Anaerococcus sp. NML200537 TaxID=2954485 RepID=UPI0022382FB1|nr:rhodanese-like domain-containing protein [Anaerococcus sp. NML200537]MCW6702285.1 rhodanese-like domain-containing protein [Anaerococcus sp. NML200537]
MHIKEITGDDLLKLDDSYKIIDVRSEEEYKNGHIKNSINIPLDKIMENDIDLDKSDKLVVHCRTNGRAGRALAILDYLGYKDLTLAPGVDLYDYNLVK